METRTQKTLTKDWTLLENGVATVMFWTRDQRPVEFRFDTFVPGPDDQGDFLDPKSEPYIFINGNGRNLYARSAFSRQSSIEYLVGFQTSGGGGPGGPINISDVNGLQTALNDRESKQNRNVVNGYLGLGSDGKASANNLPAASAGTYGILRVFDALDKQGFTRDALSADAGFRLFRDKAAKATTLQGYGIEDAYTKAQTNAQIQQAIEAGGGGGGGSDTPQELLEKLKTVDGSSSGLDSNFLEGKRASDFILTSLINAAGGVAGLDPTGGLSPTIQGFRPDVINRPDVFVPLGERLGKECYITDGYRAGDNVTDFSDLVAANLALAIATKRPLIIPADEFFVSRQFVGQNESISIFGYGMSKSVLTWKTGSESVGLEFSFNNERHSVRMADFGLWTQVRDFGRAIKLDFANTVDQNGGNPVVAGRFFPKAHLSDLLIGGRGNTPNNGFRHGIDINIGNAVTIEGCALLGGIQGADPNYIAGTAIRMGAPDGNGYGHPTVAKVNRNYFQHWQAGIIFEGMEGAYAEQNDIVGVKIGIWFKDNYGRPQFNVANNHINCSQVGIWAQGSGELNLKGNLIYNVIGNTTACTGILVNGNFSVGGIITQNNFANTAYNGQSALNSIIIEAGRDILIDHNVFRKNSNDVINGIWLTGGSKRCVVGPSNLYENESFGTVGFRVIDQGSENMQPGYGARFGKSSSQGSSGGLDIVTFDTLADLTGNPNDNMQDGAFVIPSDGIWMFSGGCLWDNGGSAVLTLNIQLNATSGNPIVSQQARAEPGNSIALSVATVPKFYPKNTVVRLGANSGGSGRTILANLATFFEVRRLA